MNKIKEVSEDALITMSGLETTAGLITMQLDFEGDDPHAIRGALEECHALLGTKQSEVMSLIRRLDVAEVSDE